MAFENILEAVASMNRASADKDRTLKAADRASIRLAKLQQDVQDAVDQQLDSQAHLIALLRDLSGGERRVDETISTWGPVHKIQAMRLLTGMSLRDAKAIYDAHREGRVVEVSVQVKGHTTLGDLIERQMEETDYNDSSYR